MSFIQDMMARKKLDFSQKTAVTAQKPAATATAAPTAVAAPTGMNRTPAPTPPRTAQPSGPAIPVSTAINQAAPTSTPVPAPSAGIVASTMTADQRQLQPGGTVQDRLQGVIDQNGALMKLAEGRAMQAANSRGLLNTSMAVGAGQKAVLDAAMPIASQDAEAFNRQQLTNQDANNSAKQFNAGAENTAKLAKLDADLKTWSQNSQQSHAEFMSKLDHWKNLGTINAEAYANLKGKYVDAATQLHDTMLINISEIQKADNMTADVKTKLIEQQQKMAEGSIKAMSTLYSSLPMWQQNWMSFPSM